ncbi:ATP-binding protein [Gordonia hankookensis]|nr:adenylate/guanylate cyclase domain-containing protein [Gordonia hankookensis]
MTCGSCGTGLRDHAKFCDECGAAVAVPGGAAKYKQVTVLFADVVRSMGIAAAVDIERLREIMTELMERSATVIHRYGGTVEYTGDGVMAIFGAPIALEDHAFRGCLAALAIQEDEQRLAGEVQRRDGLALRLRIGLNSGQVIADEIDSGRLGYSATGEAIGFAQRMESAAPPGGVMLSESTARLVENAVTLGEPEYVRIKGRDDPVLARRLIGIGLPGGRGRRAEVGMVGRRSEMSTLATMVDRTVAGHGEVANVVGPAGIGKSRMARETAALAAARGLQVWWVFCESHARDIPFHTVRRLLRVVNGIEGLDARAARARLREHLPNADPVDLHLLDDLLEIAAQDRPVPQIDPDARRRRLIALLGSMSLNRTTSALVVIEDAHWIDPVSESMLADLLGVVTRAPSMALITSRTEHQGALTKLRDSQSIVLAPLDDSDTAALLDELLGSDPSIRAVAEVIAVRAAGNPFFAEEMVRELAERGLLTGDPGSYVCLADVAELTVPATVQAVIAARIDRLGASAKQTLNVASVIGHRFGVDLFAALGITPVVDELISAELIDRVQFSPIDTYIFRHPLIRAVAYESQLRSDRAETHRRLAVAMRASEPPLEEENAALIAGHLQAAGRAVEAYSWHMRAGVWSTARDLAAARLSWDRAQLIADGLPEDMPERPAMRIAPRTMLCATDYQGGAVDEAHGRFAELRGLCDAVGDKVSLAIGMTGPLTELVYGGHIRAGSRLATEQMELLESIGDPDLTMPLSFLAFAAWFENGEIDEIARWSQIVIDLAGGDPQSGAGFGVGSPLAIALTWRGFARYWLGRAGWRHDLHDAVAMARRSSSPAGQYAATLAAALTWSYAFAIQNGVLRADDDKVRALGDGVLIAESSGNDVALSLAEYGLGIALLSRDTATDRDRGLMTMTKVRDTWMNKNVALQDVPIAELWIAREVARRDGHAASIPVMRRVVDELHEEDRLGYCVWATGVLVGSLLVRGRDHDLAEAQAAVERLGAVRAEQESAIRAVSLVRLRALLARARGDLAGFRELVGRYRVLSESYGFDGHCDWAQAMGENHGQTPTR